MLNTETIWLEYRKTLRAFLARRVANPDDVDDLLQEVMLRSHRQLDGLRSADNLRAWLFRIARNVTIDHYRSKGRARDIDPDDLWYGVETPDTIEELEQCVELFLKNLPAEDAELLRLIDLQHVEQKTHASALGVSYSTLKSRVQAARKRLHGQFADCCNFAVDPSGRIIDYEQKPKNCKNC